MDQSYCPDCGAEVDEADNFCRRCGAAVRAARIPVVRNAQLPAVWRPVVSPAAKGAALMAAGTVGQYLLRRVARSVLGGADRPPRTLSLRRTRDRDGMIDDAQIITETVMMRRVRVRRRP